MNTKVVKSLKAEGISWEGGLELLDACVDDIAYARHLLRQGNRNVNWKDTEAGVSILHTLAYSDSSAQMKLLIEYGADINIRNKNDETPLHWCAKLNSKDCAKLLLDHNCDPLITDISGSTPLHCAAAAGHVEVVPLLLDSPAGEQLVQLLDGDGATAIELAFNGKTPSFYAITVLLARFYQKHGLNPPKNIKNSSLSQYLADKIEQDNLPHDFEKHPQYITELQRQQQYQQQHHHNHHEHSYMDMRDSDVLHKLQQLHEPREVHIHDSRDHTGPSFNVKHVHAVPVSSTHGGVGEDITGISSMNLTPPLTPRHAGDRKVVAAIGTTKLSLPPHTQIPQQDQTHPQQKKVVIVRSHSSSPPRSPPQSPPRSPTALGPLSPRSPRSRPGGQPAFRPSSPKADVSRLPAQKSPRSPKSHKVTESTSKEGNERSNGSNQTPTQQIAHTSSDSGRSFAQRRKSLAHVGSSRPTIASLLATGEPSLDGGDSGSGKKVLRDDSSSHLIHADSSHLTYDNRSNVKELFHDSARSFERFIGNRKVSAGQDPARMQKIYNSKQHVHRSLAQRMFPIAQNLPLLPSIKTDRDRGVDKVHTEFLDVIIAVEHCTDCEKHNGQSLRHNPAKYVKIANDVLFAVIKAVADAKFAVRLYALRVEPTARDRLGAMEVTIAANITCPLLSKLEAITPEITAATIAATATAAGAGSKGKFGQNALHRTSTQTAQQALMGSARKGQHQNTHNDQHQQQQVSSPLTRGNNKNNRSRYTIAQSFDSSLPSNNKIAEIAAAAATVDVISEERRGEGNDGEEEDDDEEDEDEEAAKPPPGWATYQLYSKLATKSWPNSKMIASGVVSFLRGVLKEASVNYHSIADLLREEGVLGEDDDEDDEDDSSNERSGSASGSGSSGGNDSGSDNAGENEEEEEDDDDDDDEDKRDKRGSKQQPKKKKVGDYVHSIISEQELQDVQRGYAEWVQRMKIPPRLERHELDLDWPEDLLPPSPSKLAEDALAQLNAAASTATIKAHPLGPMLDRHLEEQPSVSRSTYEKLALEHFLVFDSKIRPPSYHKHHHHHNHHNHNHHHNHHSQHHK